MFLLRCYELKESFWSKMCHLALWHILGNFVDNSARHLDKVSLGSEYLYDLLCTINVGRTFFGRLKKNKNKSSNLQSHNPDFSCWYPCVRDALHHLIRTAIAPAVPPSHFDAATFKDSLKHQTGAL